MSNYFINFLPRLLLKNTVKKEVKYVYICTFWNGFHLQKIIDLLKIMQNVILVRIQIVTFFKALE